ncbi:MAG: methyltransferase domain-containing protein [SAR324 cluster bacterium]|uniref:Ribosomal RNA large subunit methyltransferase E n=1 Tax=SAR324 cluster bacterium TaxID=2024889 RepID=A0A7X9FQN0_9DELT|nr:methyltransferase domain-containing protein [SAR324 cluster bacterium]
MASNYKRKDHYYQEAKDQGFRSRAAFKLVEVQKKYNLIKPGSKVLDLGCWPGGWLQIAAEFVGPQGKVIGVDLVETEFLKESNVITLQGDVRSEATLEKCLNSANGSFDVILSDMAPKLSGIREVDENATLECAELAYGACKKCLKMKGAIVIKMFKSASADEFVKRLRLSFAKVSRVELDSTRKTSNEFYVIATAFKG